jgi:hypothetical protein
MSIATLTQVYDEVRRLAIAGSSVAPGDFRLKKLIPPLEQAGAKAPVFAKVAQAVQALVDSTEKTASPALLELTTLVGAVLYTQGETGIEGTLEPIATTDLGIRATQTSARAIKPLVEALSTTGSGRVEIVRDAIERKLFHDLRLVRPAVRAIDDPYPEIADLIAEHVLPLYGKAIVPELKASFDLKSKSAGHQRRLKLMHRLDPAATRELVQQALEGGSKEIKIVAIECLGASDADIGYLLEQSKAKAKDVRAAALRAIARAPSQTVESVKSLLTAIEGDDVELIARVEFKQRVPAIDSAVVEQLTAQIANVLKEKDAAKLGAAILRAMHLVDCLKGSTDAKAEALLIDIIDKAPKLANLKAQPAGSDLNEVVARVGCTATDAVKRRLAETKAADISIFDYAVRAAYEVYSPQQFYDVYSPALRNLAPGSGKRGRAVDLAKSVEGVFCGKQLKVVHGLYFYLEAPPRSDIPIDPRWIDLAIEIKRTRLVCHLIPSGHAKAAAYLTDIVKDKKADDSDRTDALAALQRIGHPGIVDLMGHLISTSTSENLHHFVYNLMSVIPKLSIDALPAIEALYQRLPEAFADEWIEPIAQLKRKTV